MAKVELHYLHEKQRYCFQIILSETIQNRRFGSTIVRSNKFVRTAVFTSLVGIEKFVGTKVPIIFVGTAVLSWEMKINTKSRQIHVFEISEKKCVMDFNDFSQLPFMCNTGLFIIRELHGQ